LTDAPAGAYIAPMDIVGLPLLSDNYAWLLIPPGGRDCAVVDPSEADPVARAIAERGLTLRWILATHHHPDHTGGIRGLWREGIEVVASAHDRERIPCVTRAVADGDTFEVFGETVQCLHVPGHTLGAVAYYVAASKAVFTGDTLFTAGCGRLFEGTPAQMHTSLNRLAALPGDVGVYCGHEYTEKNLRFALTLEPGASPIVERLREVERLRAEGAPTVPATLAVERETNPFLRTAAPAMRRLAGKEGGVEVLAELRQRRDHF
jgi:hydroxyacylglutathione hydrolase